MTWEEKVNTERARQDAKWGEQNHSLEIWMLILGEEFGELQQAILEAYMKYGSSITREDYQKIKKELVQVAAVCKAIDEYMNREL